MSALLAALPMPLAAQGQTPEQTQHLTLESMLARDRLAAPEGELAAWQQFSAQVAADSSAGPAADPELRSRTRLGLAIALLYTKDFAAGWDEITAARALMEQLPAPPTFEAELLASEALLLIELGRTDEARAKADAALVLATTRGAEGLRDQALAHNALGGLAFAANDIHAAETAYCTARDLGLAAPIPDHPMIVNDASSCGVVKYYLEVEGTVEAMRLASDYAFAHLPADHPKMGNVLNSTYAVLLRYGRYAEAEPLIRRHLELERRLSARDNEDIYDPLSMLGRALELRGSYADAEAIFTAAAAMADQLRDQGQPYNRGIAQTNLARVIGQQGRLEEAEAVARGGLERLIEDLEPGDWNIGSGQVRLADHLDRLGRRDEALALVDQGLSTLDAALDPAHGEVLMGRLLRGRILAELGRGEEALGEVRGAIALFEAQMFDLAASEQERIALSRTLPAAFGDYIETALASGAMDDAVRSCSCCLNSPCPMRGLRLHR